MKLRQLILGALLTTGIHAYHATNAIDYYSTSAGLCYTAAGTAVAEKSNLSMGRAGPHADNQNRRHPKHPEWQLNLSPPMVVAVPFGKLRVRPTETVSI